jgi:hypothetical protein
MGKSPHETKIRPYFLDGRVAHGMHAGVLRGSLCQPHLFAPLRLHRRKRRPAATWSGPSLRNAFDALNFHWQRAGSSLPEKIWIDTNREGVLQQ